MIIDSAFTILTSCGSLGIFRSFLQSLMLRYCNPVKYSNDEGNSLIPLKDKFNSFRHFISGWISGNFSSLEQSCRLKYWRDFNMRLLGRIWSFEQPLRFHTLSFSRNPMDSWTSIKFLQFERSNVFKFGQHKSGNFVMDSHSLRLILFKFSYRNSYRKKDRKSVV